MVVCSCPPPRAGFLLNQCYNSSISTYPMSEEQLKAFLEKVKADTSLQEKLKAAADSDAVLAIAKDAGFSISADDLKNAPQEELSDEELESVAGGYPGKGLEEMRGKLLVNIFKTLQEESIIPRVSGRC